jgi:hypothetical protein
MTRNHDRQRILAIGGADRPERSGCADRVGQIQVAPSLAERYFSQSAPNSFLKFTPARLKRKLKPSSLAGEILPKLSLALEEDRMPLIKLRRVQPYSAWAFLFPKNGD